VALFVVSYHLVSWCTTTATQWHRLCIKHSINCCC